MAALSTETPAPSPESPTIVDRVKAAPLSFAIAAVNVAWFLWAESHGPTTSIPILLRFGAVEPNLVRAGEYWRVASYMFMHIGWAHLLLNTFAGLTWCMPVERILGWRRFLLVYLVAGIGGGVACVMFSKAVTAGASGAMFGITGSLLAIQYRLAGSFKAFSADRSVRSTAFQIGLWTVLGVYAIPMSQAGHFGGLITGALMTLIISLRQQRRAAWAVFAVAFTGFTIAAVRPWLLLSAGHGSVDFATVKLGRLGQPTENAERVEAQAPVACAKGVQRACVVAVIANLDPEHKDACRSELAILVPACNAGDQDACATEGQLVGVGCGTPQDIERYQQLIADACKAGSEYACELQ